jgi:hypothetical protein
MDLEKAFNRVPNSCGVTLSWTASSTHHLPMTNIKVGSTQVTPSTSVRDSGIFIDSDLVMSTHVQRVVSHCFALYVSCSVSIYRFQRLLSRLIVSLVLSCLDYGNDTLLAIYLQRRLKLMLNSSDRLIYDLLIYDVCWSDHFTDALASLHWLRIPERTTYKTALLTFRALRGKAP